MTTVFFIRHAESDKAVYCEELRPLTKKGRLDSVLVTQFLADKNIDVIFSSPYVRAVDTISDFAKKYNLTIQVINDFKEHQTISDNYQDSDYFPFIQRYWADMKYSVDLDESLFDVQRRNICALNKILKEHQDENIVIGTHGIALSTIINYFDNSFGYEDFCNIVKLKPWAVKMEFNCAECISIEKIDLLSTKSKIVC